MAAEKQKCMIIGAVPLDDGRIFREFDPGDYYVICADAGYETAEKHGITPDLIVGDFDSAAKKPEGKIRSVSLPVEKDVTDTMFAALRGLSRGCRSFVLIGCLGGARFDHTMANLEVLQYLKDHGARAVLADEHTRVMLLRSERLHMTGMKGATVSVFPIHDASCTVSYRGLQYPLDHQTLRHGGLLMGVSNQIVSDAAEIMVHIGTALTVIYQP